jgi:hypothetical protein
VGFGSPKEVADELIAWVEETDVDGFNLAYTATPETFPDFVDLVVPELQKRGRYNWITRSARCRKALLSRSRAARRGSSSGEVPQAYRSARQPIAGRNEPPPRRTEAGFEHSVPRESDGKRPRFVPLDEGGDASYQLRVRY